MELEKIETLAKKRISESKSEYDIRLKFPNEYAMNLAYGRRTKGANTAAWRSNYFYPTIPATIRTYIPRLIDGLIGPDGTNFFELEAESDMDENNMSLKMSADIITAIQNKHFADEGMFYATQSKIEQNACIFGVGYSITGWEDFTEKYTYYRPEGERLFKESISKRTNRPTRYCPSSTDIFVDPAANCWEDKTYVVERQSIRLSKLKAMVNKWNIKERFNDVLGMIEKQIISDYANNRGNRDTKDITSASSIDPVQTIYNVYEKGSITTMWMNYCIRYVDHPFAHNNIPVYAYQFEPDFYRYAPKGLPLILCDINEAQNTALNLMFDSWVISVNPTFKQRRTSFIDTQDKTWEPGKVLMVDDMNDFAEMQKSNTNVESSVILEKLAGIANQASGSMDYLNAPTGVASVNKTYGGARMIKAEANMAMARIIKHQKETALKPELQDMLMNYYQFLDKDTVTELLGEKKALELNYSKGFKIAWDSKWKYKLSGNISMVDKQSKLENIQQAVELFTGLYQTVQNGVPINPAPIVKQILDTLEIDKSILDVQAPQPQPQLPQGAPAQAQGGVNVASNPSTLPAIAQGTAVKTPPTAALTPEEIQSMPVIAEKLGIDPERLMADLQQGLIPGGYALLDNLAKNPQAINKFKQQLIAREK